MILRLNVTSCFNEELVILARYHNAVTLLHRLHLLNDSFCCSVDRHIEHEETLKISIVRCNQILYFSKTGHVIHKTLEHSLHRHLYHVCCTDSANFVNIICVSYLWQATIKAWFTRTTTASLVECQLFLFSYSPATMLTWERASLQLRFV